MALALCATAAIAQQQPHPEARLTHVCAPEPGRELMDRLRALLQLRPEQSAATAAYVTALRQSGDALRPMEPQPVTTPERLDAMTRRIAEREGRAKARIDATRAFYGQLDATQKQAFDALPSLLPLMADPSAPMVRLTHVGPPSGITASRIADHRRLRPPCGG